MVLAIFETVVKHFVLRTENRTTSLPRPRVSDKSVVFRQTHFKNFKSFSGHCYKHIILCFTKSRRELDLFLRTRNWIIFCEILHEVWPIKNMPNIRYTTCDIGGFTQILFLNKGHCQDHFCFSNCVPITHSRIRKNKNVQCETTHKNDLKITFVIWFILTIVLCLTQKHIWILI